MAVDEGNEEREPIAVEMLAWRSNNVFVPDAEATPEDLPRLTNMSAGFFFGGVVRALCNRATVTP